MTSRKRDFTDAAREPDAPESGGDSDAPELSTAQPAPAAGAPAAGVPTEPAESAVQRLEDQLQEAQDKFLRLAAEFDNFRKRMARERVELTDRAQAGLVVRLLEVLDDLDRLAAQDVGQLSAEVLHEALVLVDRKLRKELETAGLQRIHPEGEPFDPSHHEAVATTAAPTPEQDHLVSAVFQSGYQFRGSLVRPARVQVYSTESGA